MLSPMWLKAARSVRIASWFAVLLVVLKPFPIIRSYLINITTLLNKAHTSILPSIKGLIFYFINFIIVYRNFVKFVAL